MKLKLICVLLAGWTLLGLKAPATTYYVNQNSATPAPPYTNWSMAATNIQDAINAATNNDLVLVTNGVYSAGGLAMAGTLTNRVTLNKPLTVQSVNGPWVTAILGAGATNGPAAVRCAWLTNNAALIGFTLQAGATATSGNLYAQMSGGGVWCASSNAIVANCVIVSNTAYYYGGGAYQGWLQNCLVITNSSANSDGGGAAYAVMTSCTVVGNPGGLAYMDVCTNCIVYSFNVSAGVVGGTYAYCCVGGKQSGVGNFTNNPQFSADGVHLAVTSPCVGAGTNLVTGTDIFGQPWNNPPSIGCAESQSAPLAGTPQIRLTGNPVGFTAGNGSLFGPPPFYFSWLDNGVPLQNSGHFSGVQTTNLTATGVSFADAGNYQLVVSNAFGAVTSSVAPLVIHCVNVAGANPVAPYLTWATAATNIQNAISIAAAEDVVLVTNGIYAGGGVSMDGVITNSVTVNKALLVESLNGPGSTIIQGAWDAVSTNGPGAVRCAWLTNNAILAGFTLQGGATRTVSASSANGGGVYGTSTNAMLYNCVINTNFAYASGGGACQATLSHCTLSGNQVTEDSYGAFVYNGAGACGCNLINCWIVSNVAAQGNGGGTANCCATNCAYAGNVAGYAGGAAYFGSLVNCTVSGNTAGNSTSPYSSAVYEANLVNGIVYGNFSRSPSGVPTNCYDCTMSYCDADPLPSGTGNVDVNPQLLADGIHLAATSPCIGAGTSNVVYGTDIDGQPWNNPPSIGCDEWQPAPVMAGQPSFQINNPAHGLTFNAAAAGQSPFSYVWTDNGTPLQDDGHHSNSGTANLVVNNFGPADTGFYQVVVSNAFGVVTSQVAQVVIHAVSAAGANPVAPYSSWATAATNIQDAINIAAAGDIVLVTNGVYAAGGLVMAGNLTNRVALNQPLTVMSVNGYAVTTIQGAWDPVTTNGPGAVRCAWIANGAVLNGFTLENGATRAAGDTSSSRPLEGGGGAWCNSTNGLVSNCVFTNNCAMYGGGLITGTADNSLLIFNQAFAYGGGADGATLNNCTVINNFANTSAPGGVYGAGVCFGIVNNCIILNNFDNAFSSTYNTVMLVPDNCYYADVYYSCTPPGMFDVIGDIDVSPEFLDLFNIAAASPCRGMGSPLYASGTDLDGEAWANPPSMGCGEVVVTNLVGPLAVSLLGSQTNGLVNHYLSFAGSFTGRASGLVWTFGPGAAFTNSGPDMLYAWTNAGNYSVTFTVYNNDNPAGVSASTVIDVLPLTMPQLLAAAMQTNGFQFQFTGQTSANYTILYATNLMPPVSWNTLQSINNSTGGLYQITDTAATNGPRFYRVQAQ